MPAARIDPEAAVLGGKLSHLREELDLTQKDVGERMGLTDAGYGHYETGRARIILSDVPRFAFALGVSVLDLLIRLEMLGAADVPADDDTLRAELIARLGSDQAELAARGFTQIRGLPLADRREVIETFVASAEYKARRHASTSESSVAPRAAGE